MIFHLFRKYPVKILDHIERAIKGIKILLSIRKTMKINRNRLAIVLSGAIGDNVYSLAYLDAIAEAFREDPVIVCSPVNFTVMGAYDIKKKIIFPLEKKEYLDSFIRSAFASELGLFLGIFNANPIHFRRFYHQKDNRCLYQMTKIYGISEKSKVTLPNVKGQWEDPELAEMEKFGNNVVIINSYSNGMDGKRVKQYFDNMINYFTRKGFVIYSNLAPGQKEMEKTLPLNCSITDLYKICSRIKPLFVSVRSGICDWIISSGVNMFVMYTGRDDSAINMFKLSEWNPRGGVVEVNADKCTDNEIMCRFFEWVTMSKS